MGKRLLLVPLRDTYDVDHGLGVLVRKDTGRVVHGCAKRGQVVIATRAGQRNIARVIYAIVHGVEPGRNHVLHIDGNPRNNRPDNLRLTDFEHARAAKGAGR